MICKQCGREISEDAKVCYFCGSLAKKDESIRCPECGKVVENTDEFCRFCGKKLEDRVSEIPEELEYDDILEDEDIFEDDIDTVSSELFNLDGENDREGMTFDDVSKNSTLKGSWIKITSITFVIIIVVMACILGMDYVTHRYLVGSKSSKDNLLESSSQVIGDRLTETSKELDETNITEDRITAKTDSKTTDSKTNFETTNITSASVEKVSLRGINYQIEGEQASILNCDTEEAFLFIPRTVNDVPVVEIQEEAFKSCKTLEYINISEGVERILKGAFLDMPNLLAVRLPSSVSYIEEGCFDENTAIVAEPGTYAWEYGESNNIMCWDVNDSSLDMGSHTYQVFPASASWSTAKNYCEEMGGHLVTITSLEEQQAIYSIIDNGSKLFYWMGATDEEVEGNWRWITKEMWKYTNWCQSPMQPDNQSSYGGNENYIAMLRSNGQWLDLQNTADPEGDSALIYSGFICEWEDASAEQNEPHEIVIDDITYCITDLGAELIHCQNQSARIELPDMVEGVKLTRIGDYSFSGCSNLKYIDIPEGVTEVGGYAFCDSTNIAYMVLPDSLENIMDWALNAPNISFICHVGTYAQTYAETYKRPWSEGDSLP